MAELREIDPKLLAIRDKETGRNLLDPSNPNPLVIDTSDGRAVRFGLVIENGPQGLMNLTIASDETWLEPETKRLTLVGGERGLCLLTAAPEGDAEFATLLFSWGEPERPFSTSIVLMRTLPGAARPAPAAPARPAAAAPPALPLGSGSRRAGPYTAEISRSNRTCFLFLVDHSGSMRQEFAGQAGRSKAQCVAEALNRLLFELLSRSSSGTKIKDYYDVGVIGYGEARVGPALGGDLAGQRLVSITQLREHPLRVETRVTQQRDFAGNLVETVDNVPVWYESQARGKTPMCQALAAAQEVVEDFVRRNPRCFPPVVINITDGEATDGDPEPRAAALRALASEDGHVLLFNLHISSSAAQPIQFAAAEAALPDVFAKRLFRMSSPLPAKMLGEARAMEIDVADGARGFVFNANMAATIQMLSIGTLGARR